jgi:polyhydroxyalkanoate synthase
MQRLPTAHQQLPQLPFQVGQDVAITPGVVVFRNELIELIQYAPTTAKVDAEPLLIIPSCIMKYYILDLSPHNSMVKYLVDQGLTVFMVSWRNPTSDDRDLSMDDYVKLGVLDVIEQVQHVAQTSQLHSMGYCLGGTFLAIAAAYLARDGQASPLASVSLLAAQTDFSEPGELGVYIDDDQLLTLREEMAEKGYLSGRQMAASFQFLNSRDLIWSRNTQRYWLGQDEVGNDMMSWNMDTTRLPERMHNDYLDQLFLNDAITQGHYRTQGHVIALMDIRSPMFVVGTTRDHISPWKSVYKIHLSSDAPMTFALASGGHNAGIVSEPGHAHRSYQIMTQNDRHAWVSPDEWVQQAPVVQGSWWQDWVKWLHAHSGLQLSARALPKGATVSAPGTYVLVRYAD